MRSRRGFTFITVPLHGILVFSLVWIIRHLPLNTARQFLGWLGETIGSRLKKNRTTQKNISRVFPHLSSEEVKFLSRKMWRNLGYVVAEYIHINAINIFNSPHIEMIGLEHLEALKGKPAIIVSGHLSNWELISKMIFEMGAPLSQVYRAANHPWINRLIRKLQSHAVDDLIPKGPAAGKKSLMALKKNRWLVLLVDQKMNTGIELPFFNQPAMTSPGAASLALYTKCPLVPIQVQRRGIEDFTIHIHPPIDPQQGMSQEEIMIQIHTLLEDWIREKPEEWLWVHNRWKNI